MTLTPTFIRVLDENSTADAKGYGTHDDHIGGASRGESVSLGTSTNASGNARSASPSGRRSGKASAWVEWISNHLYGILVAAVSALLIGIVLWRYGALVLAILGRLLLYGTIIFVLWFLAQLLECIARLLEELGWCPELAKALRQKAEAFRRLMDTCMAGFARGAEIFLEALQGLLEWLKDKVAPASK
jgi:hypothetical protein